jgi:hypothetical protein
MAGANIDKFTAADSLGDVSVTKYLRECVTIEPLALEEEFLRVPADLAYWGARFADAQKEAALAKLHRDEVEAAIDKEHRSDAAAMGEKVTEKVISSRVQTDERMKAIELSLIDAEALAMRTKAFADAVRAKKDMVIALGSQVRAEMAADPSIRQQMTGRHYSKGV